MLDHLISPTVDPPGEDVGEALQLCHHHFGWTRLATKRQVARHGTSRGPALVLGPWGENYVYICLWLSLAIEDLGCFYDVMTFYNTRIFDNDKGCIFLMFETCSTEHAQHRAAALQWTGSFKKHLDMTHGSKHCVLVINKFGWWPGGDHYFTTSQRSSNTEFQQNNIIPEQQQQQQNQQIINELSPKTNIHVFICFPCLNSLHLWHRQLSAPVAVPPARLGLQPWQPWCLGDVEHRSPKGNGENIYINMTYL